MELKVVITKGKKSRQKDVAEFIYQSDISDINGLMLKVLRRHKSNNVEGWTIKNIFKALRDERGRLIELKEIK